MMMELINSMDGNLQIPFCVGLVPREKTSCLRSMSRKLTKSKSHNQNNNNQIVHSVIKPTPNHSVNRQSMKVNWQVLKSKSCANIKNNLHYKSNVQTIIRQNNIRQSLSFLQINNKVTKYPNTKESPLILSTQTIQKIHSLRKQISNIGKQKFILPNKETTLQSFVGLLQRRGLLNRLKNNDSINQVERKQKNKRFIKKGSTLQKNTITNLIKSKLVHQNNHQTTPHNFLHNMTIINKVCNDSNGNNADSLGNFSKIKIRTIDYPKDFQNSQNKIEHRLRTSHDGKPTISDKQIMWLEGWQIQSDFQDQIMTMQRNSF